MFSRILSEVQRPSDSEIITSHLREIFGTDIELICHFERYRLWKSNLEETVELRQVSQRLEINKHIRFTVSNVKNPSSEADS